MSYNKVILIGNAGKDPEVKYFDRESCVATFSLATNERGYTKPNGEEVPPSTDWHHITTFKHTAMFVEKYVRKGAYVFVEGRIRYRLHSDPRGQSHKTTEIIADKVEILGKSPLSSDSAQVISETPTTPDPDKYKKYTDMIKGMDPDLPF